MYKISVVVPIYNRVRFVDELVISILNQSLKDFELVIVDNQSNDGTWERLVHHASTDGRIKLYRNEQNIGPILNWKKAISLAQGLYTKILFSDDLLFRTCLEQMYSSINKKIGFVACSPLVGKNIRCARIRYRKSFTKEISIINSASFIRHALLDYGGLVSPSAALFRTGDLLNAFVQEIDYPAGDSFSYFGAGPDLLFFLLIAERYAKIVWINKPLVFFRDHPDSATSAARSRGKFDIKLGYTLAKIWFARSSTFSFYANILIIRNWIFLKKRGIRFPFPGIVAFMVYPFYNFYVLFISILRNR